jgi:hypothetical protein
LRITKRVYEEDICPHTVTCRAGKSCGVPRISGARLKNIRKKIVGIFFARLIPAQPISAETVSSILPAGETPLFPWKKLRESWLTEISWHVRIR